MNAQVTQMRPQIGTVGQVAQMGTDLDRKAADRDLAKESHKRSMPLNDQAGCEGPVEKKTRKAEEQALAPPDKQSRKERLKAPFKKLKEIIHKICR
jgi:hypothetical protein